MIILSFVISTVSNSSALTFATKNCNNYLSNWH